jgi:hypothetical protein
MTRHVSLATLCGLLTTISANAYVLHGNDWGEGPVTVTYSFMATGVNFDESPDYVGTITALADFMPPGWKAEIEAALAAWEAVTDITFVEVADQGEDFNAFTQLSGDIRFGGHAMDGAFGTLAHGFYPPPNGWSAAGDVHFDTAENWTVNSRDGDNSTLDIFNVAAHEIGHAIGLAHSADPNALMAPFYSESITGVQPDDAAGAMAMYGGLSVAPEPTILPLVAVGLLGVFGLRQR